MSRTPSDYQLCLRYRDGDQRAFDELLCRHRNKIHYYANQFDLPGMEREDAEQAALLGLLKAARDYRSDVGASFRSFADLTISRAVITALVTANRNKHQLLGRALRLEMPVDGEDGPGEFGDVLSGDPNDDPCEVVLRRETLASHVRTLWECSEVEQTVVARLLSGCSLAEAGKGLGRPESDGRKVADNAIQRVRRKLAAAA